MTEKPRTFEEWFDAYSQNYSKDQWSLRDSWNARDSEVAAKDRRIEELERERDILRNSVESYVRIASGNDQEIIALRSQSDRVRALAEKMPHTVPETLERNRCASNCEKCAFLAALEMR
jgi:uncharacterized coiled-coil DUF342 family protein